LREARGRDDEIVEVAAGTSLGALFRATFSGKEAAMPVAFARNHEIARADDVVADGDVVVFLPPVGGG
jgi:molybdopterin converting factor small subunit